VTQVLLAFGALGVAVLVGFGALSTENFGQPRSTPRPTPIPLVSFTTPSGWVVGENDAVLTLARGPVAGKATVARITVCRNAYEVAADGALSNGLKTDATAIAFGLARRDDLRTVLTPHAVTLAGMDGYYLDFNISKPSRFVGETDTWLARTDQASCLAVLDTSDEESNVDPATQVTVPVIVRLGIFGLPDGDNLLVLIASEGIGTRAKPDKTDIDEATAIVDGFTFHTAPRP
jgi:hypothetical protein